MNIYLLPLLAIISQTHSLFNPKDEVDMEIDIIEFKMQTNISLYLDTELLTCQGVGNVIENLERNLHFYLDVSLYDVWNTLDIAYDVADHKNGICLNETSDKIDAIIEKEIYDFVKSVKITKMKLHTLLESLNNDTSAFDYKKQVILGRMQKCYYQYPAIYQRQNREACINIYKEFLQKIADGLAVTLGQSACMQLLQDEVLTSIKDMSGRIKENTEHVLNEVACGDNNSEDRVCLKTIPHVPDFQPSIIDQVKDAQSMYREFKEKIFKGFSDYINEEYDLRRKYDFSPKPVDEFLLLLNQTLEPKLWQLKEMMQQDLEGYGHCLCEKESQRFIADTIYKGSQNMTNCFEDLVQKITREMKYIRNSILTIVRHMKGQGDAAILQCITLGNIFNKNVVFNCCNVTFKPHNWETIKTSKIIEEKKKSLESLLQYIRDPSNTLPCIVEQLELMESLPDFAMFGYNVCFDTQCRRLPDKQSTKGRGYYTSTPSSGESPAMSEKVYEDVHNTRVEELD